MEEKVKKDQKELHWILLFVLGVYLITILGYVLRCYVVSLGYMVIILAPTVMSYLVIAVSHKEIRINMREYALGGIMIGSMIPTIYICLTAVCLIIFKGNISLHPVQGSFIVQMVLTWLFGGFCEEVGWRGVLFPLLRKRMAYWKSCVAVGCIWFGWHIPMILTGEILGMFPKILGIPLFLIENVSLSFIMGAVSQTKYGKSVWPYMMIHAVHNIMVRTMVELFGKEWESWIDDGGYLLNIVLIIVAVGMNVLVSVHKSKAHYEKC